MRHAAAVILILALVFGALPVGAQETSEGPRLITGTYETTNPIYPLIGADAEIILYDLAGLIAGNYNYTSPLDEQILGRLNGDLVSGTYRIELPDEPAGILVDFDGDEATPPAVQVYASATFIDFLASDAMERGELPLDFSVRIDPLSYGITGGQVIAWSAEDGAAFPAGLGADGAAFTADDPLMTLPAGWSVIELDSEPFTVLRDAQVEIGLIESLGALNDYTAMSYSDAWEALFARTQETYPFTAEKDLDWNAIYAAITPGIERAESMLEFHLAIATFGGMIPDMHIGYASVQVMQSFLIGGVGISELVVTDDGQVVITGIEPSLPAAQAGIMPYDILVAVDGDPALDVLDATPMLITSASTPHTRRLVQAATMLQGALGSEVTLTWRSTAGEEQTQTLNRVLDVSSILNAFDPGEGSQPVVYGQILDSGVGYIRVRGFAEEVSRADDLFADTLTILMDADAQGIIIDVRDNTGGLVNLAMAMSGHFFQDYRRVLDFYYANGEGGFSFRGYIETLPVEPYYDGPVAVLVNSLTGSAGDLFAYTMQLNDQAIIVGHTPTGGYTGEVSDGQYQLPGMLTVQIPTGRPVDPDTGETMIEGEGVSPTVRVPLTLDSLRSDADEVLQAAEAALLAAAE